MKKELIIKFEGQMTPKTTKIITFERAPDNKCEETYLCKQKLKINKKLYSYGSKEPLNTAGEFEAKLCYKDGQCAVCFIVVEEKARPILSLQTSELLAILKLKINSVSEEN